ncbi:MAG: hypothetical protein AVDCRST_MAG34-2591, partial [uncultured Nocardioidaceae bacterium]
DRAVLPVRVRRRRHRGPRASLRRERPSQRPHAVVGAPL